jgi:hypothetical protein
MSVLAKILVDSRHDWPTNGAALAILQYSNATLSNTEIYLKLGEAQIPDLIRRFILECRNAETKRHLQESIAFLEMAEQKMHGIMHIYTKCVFAACA